MAVSDLLGQGLPQGTSVNIKIGGNQPTGQNGTQNGSPRRILGREQGEDVGERVGAGAGRCPEGQIWRPGLGCVDRCGEGEIWNPIKRQCVPKILKPWEACEAKGGTWKADPVFPNRGECIMPEPEPTDYNSCMEICNADPTMNREDCYAKCIQEFPPEVTPEPEPTPEPTPSPGDCDPATEYWNATTGRCEKLITPAGPEPPPIPGAGDWKDYWNIIAGDDEFAVEMRYWNTQRDEINRAFNEGWLDIEASLAASGYGYSDRTMQYRALHERGREMALREAYSEIMYTGLERHLEKLKLATQFFLGDKELEITHAYNQGRLTLDQFKLAIEEKLGWANVSLQARQLGISEQELVIALFRAQTERILANATIDQAWTTIWGNFLQIMISLGQTEAQARETFNQILANFGQEQGPF